MDEGQPQEALICMEGVSTIDRNVVEHNYHDYSKEILTEPDNAAEVQLASLDSKKSTAKGGVAVPFPIKLHAMLDQIEEDGLASVISWQPHGRCFVVHDQKKFVENVMPTYFRQSKFPSFQRQLNLYGFQRLTSGRDKGGYYHELFLRGKRFLAHRIQRMKVKGTGVRKAASPETEPQFYEMPPVGAQNPKPDTGRSSQEIFNLSSSAKAVREAILRNALQRLQHHQRELGRREQEKAEIKQKRNSRQKIQDLPNPSSGTFVVGNTHGSDSDPVSSISDDEEDDEKEFAAILSSLVKMPVEHTQEQHPLADDSTLGNLFEILTK